MVSCSAPRSATASFAGATRGIVPCALAESANWRTGPFPLAGIHVACETEQVTLVRSPGGERSSVGEQCFESAARLWVGNGDRRAERGVVEMPVHPCRAADSSFELLCVARGDRSALAAAREELSHRRHVGARARHLRVATVLRWFAEPAAVERDRQQDDEADEQRRQSDRAV